MATNRIGVRLTLPRPLYFDSKPNYKSDESENPKINIVGVVQYYRNRTCTVVQENIVEVRKKKN